MPYASSDWGVSHPAPAQQNTNIELPVNYYHYTDISAARSIIETGRLWLTDLRFMNDTSELHTGVMCLLEACRHIYPTLLISREFQDKYVEELRQRFTAFQSNFHGQDALYAVSLSCQGDRLSQWRGYGKFAVQFDGLKLEGPQRTLSRCIYGRDEKKVEANRAVIKSLKQIATSAAASLGKEPFELSSDDLDPDNELFKQLIKEQFLSLLNLAASMKSHGFADEDEVRIIRQPQEGDEIRFRSKGNLLIPYIEIEVPMDSITGIRIGPIRDSHLTEISLKSLGDKIHSKPHPSNSTVESSRFEVSTSQVPFRE